jgi:hypothetical protein
MKHHGYCGNGFWSGLLDYCLVIVVLAVLLFGALNIVGVSFKTLLYNFSAMYL